MKSTIGKHRSRIGILLCHRGHIGESRPVLGGRREQGGRKQAWVAHRRVTQMWHIDVLNMSVLLGRVYRPHHGRNLHPGDIVVCQRLSW